jgi:hypothetical protein
MNIKMKWLILIVLFILGVRVALPFLIENRINKAIDDIEGYHGHVDDVDLKLYRGGFQLNHLTIFEEASENPEIPIVHLPLLDFSIEWRAVFKGRFVGEVYMDSLRVNFTKRKDEADLRVDSTDQRINLIQEIQKLNPILINIFEIRNGSFSYIDPTTSPKIDVTLDSFHFRAENLGNVVDKSMELPASMLMDATTLDSGTVHLDANLNYLLDPPDFDFDFKMESIHVPRFNDFFEAYANLDVEEGNFNLYAEGKARNGQLEGYSKPLIEGLEIAPADSSDGLLKKIYEGAVELGTEIFENQNEDQIGTKVPISGSLESTNTDILQSIWNFLKNAFIEAYKQEIERSINFDGNIKANEK